MPKLRAGQGCSANVKMYEEKIQLTERIITIETVNERNIDCDKYFRLDDGTQLN